MICPGCGRTWDDARRTTFLGCTRCWDTFRSELRNILLDVQGTAESHVAPPLRDQVAARRRIELERKLQEAVAREDYVAASALRDQIAQEVL